MRLNYLDVLKAFAIIAVVLYHSGFLTYGYLGVDLFLVVNGYLITKGLSKRYLVPVTLTGGGNSLVNGSNFRVKGYFDFEISRIVRLLPVLLVAGILCMLAGFFIMLPDDYENLSESVVATNLFANNILSAITTKNYWDVVNEYKPLMHTWYVGLVMQFYIVYPLLFYVARLNKKSPDKTLLTLLSLLGIVSLLFYFATEDVAQRFYYIPARFYEFAAGGVVALTWKSNEKEEKSKHCGFIYLCYVALLCLMVLNVNFVAANIRLVLVVALSSILIMSSKILENKITGNVILAKIGAASYSIFVWHQVLLAFYRYTISGEFTLGSYLLLLIGVSLLSWLTYQYIEQKTSSWLKEKRFKLFFYITTCITWIALTSYAGYIFMKGGVVRDVPELYISKNEKINHKAYNDKIYQLDKPFKTNKRHWLVVGNSFGRDFSNVILESSVADSVEVSYIYMDDYKKPEYAARYASADLVWLSSLGTNEETVKSMDAILQKNGLNKNQLVVVSTKNFGSSNGRFYVKRGTSGYYQQRTKMESGYYEINERVKLYAGERYLDLIGLVIDNNKTMPVFTPDHHFISQDCRHFSMGGAKWFATLIDWNKYLRIK